MSGPSRGEFPLSHTGQVIPWCHATAEKCALAEAPCMHPAPPSASAIHATEHREKRLTPPSGIVSDIAFSNTTRANVTMRWSWALRNVTKHTCTAIQCVSAKEHLISLNSPLCSGHKNMAMTTAPLVLIPKSPRRNNTIAKLFSR